MMWLYVVFAALALFVLGFSVGYMIGFRQGKQFVKHHLNSLYGRFAPELVWQPCLECTASFECEKYGCLHAHGKQKT
jgi:hypothetical protein